MAVQLQEYKNNFLKLFIAAHGNIKIWENLS